MSFSTFNKQFSPDKARFLSSLAVSIIVMSVVFVLTNSILNKSIKTAKEEYINRCSTTLDGYSNAVYFYLKNYKTSLESIYDENLLKTDNETEIRKWVKQNRPLLHDDFKRLFYINKKGIAYIEDDMIVDISEKGYFKEIKPVSGKINVSNVYCTENEINPVVIISIPYVDSNGEINGVLAASIEVQTLYKIKKEIVKDKNFDLYLQDRAGKFIIHIDKNYIGKTFTPNDSKHNYVTSEFISSSAPGYVETIDSRGEIIDLFYTKLPTSDWILALSFPRSQLEKIYQKRNRERFAILAISFIAILILLFAQKYVLSYFYQKQAIKIDYDSDTNLWTREKFEDVAAKLIKYSPNQKYMLIESDIRGFKFINQNYGEETANKLIFYFASKLNKITKDYRGIIGHGYADRFYSLIKIKNVTPSMTQFKIRLEELTEEIKKYDIPFYPKFGITFFNTNSKKDISIRELIGQATFAKSSIKDNMLTSYAIYNARIVDKMNETQFIETNAEQALNNNEFFVLYQPKILLSNDKIVGAEALVRWKTADGKFYTPDKFIPIFEQNGFIKKLDYYVYDKVFKFIDNQLKNGGLAVPISVNMSRNHSKPERFVNEFMRLFNKYNIPTNMIQIEIIERSIMEYNTLREITERLHNEGFTVAMDDFGSGESSLNMLSKVPVDVLKFDRDFLTSSTNDDGSMNERAAKFIASLLELGRNLEKETIFEGVETAAQRDFLKQAACDQVQGYFYSRPLTENDFIEFMKNHI